MDDSLQVRVSSASRDAADVFVRKQKFRVGPPLQFDAEYDGVTGVEHLLGAFGADLCNGFLARARKHRLEVDGVEATVEGKLDNPLVYLDVVGEEGHPGLTVVQARLYINTLHTPEEVQPVWDDTLKHSPLVNTLDGKVRLELSFKVAF